MDIEVTEYNEMTIWHKKDDLTYFHREDGPARIWNSDWKNKEEWWLNGNTYYEFECDMPLSLYLAYIKWNLK